jgi:two-component system NtrC family sensor kinase
MQETWKQIAKHPDQREWIADKGHAGERILIIDDKIEIVSFLLDLLKPLGYMLSYALSGEQGLTQAIADQPDLILLDFNMPGMSGLEVLQALRQRDCRSAVILMTLYGSESVAVRAFRLGVRDYISKPFDIGELLAAIERALEEARLRRERAWLLVELGRTNQELTHLYQQSQQQAEQLATINRIAGAVVSSLDLKEVMQTVVRSVKEILHAETATLALIDVESGELVFEVRLAQDIKEQGEWAAGDGEPVRVQIGQGIIGWSVQAGESVRVNDVPQDARFYPVVDQATGFRPRSVLCVPLSITGKVIGVIEAINKLDDQAPDGIGQFTGQDEELLSGAAAFVAMAVENARLHEAMRGTIAGQTVRDTVVTLSHYVNNPLQVLMGSAEILRLHMRDNPTAKQSADRIETEVRKIAAVMSVLRDLATPESTVYMGAIQMLDVKKELQARLAEIG